MPSDILVLDEASKSELAKLQPTANEFRRVHFISVFFFFNAICIGLPLWYWTTTPEQSSLPIEQIKQLSISPISVGVEVVILNLDPWFSESNLRSLQKTLSLEAIKSQHFDNKNRMGNKDNLASSIPVTVDYIFYTKSDSNRLINIQGFKESTIDTLNSIPPLFETNLLKSELLDHVIDHSKDRLNDAYFFVVLPYNCPLFKLVSTDGSKMSNRNSRLNSIVRNIDSHNLIYLRSPCISNPASMDASCEAGISTLNLTIMTLLQNYLVKPIQLQTVYESVWWKGNATDNSESDSVYQNHQSFDDSTRSKLARARTHELSPSVGYDITVTLVNAFNKSILPVLDDWLWTSTARDCSFGDWIRFSVNPALSDLMRHIHLNIYSQYLYAISLENLSPSHLSFDRRYQFYDSTQLSSLLNSLEAFLGQRSMQSDGKDGFSSFSNGLHLVVIVDSPHKQMTNTSSYLPLRFNFPKNGVLKTSNVALVPQWGALISVDNVNVKMENLGQILTNTIHSFIGITHENAYLSNLNKVSGKILFEKTVQNNKIAKWKMDAWLRSRAIESLSTASLTLNSLIHMVEHVPNVVIKSHVADKVHASWNAWQLSVKQLRLNSNLNKTTYSRFADVFLSSKVALGMADETFFDHSLLNLMYFPSDQVYGVYLPLFAPVCIPIFASAIKAIKYFKIKQKTNN